VLFAATNEGLNISHDNGENWKRQPFASKKPYTRTITPRGRHRRGFVANGDGPRDPGAACCGPATMASTGKMPGFRVICKVRRGWWQQIAPIPICCSPPARSGNISAATTVAKAGKRCRAD